jgi:hypothetical protein
VTFILRIFLLLLGESAKTIKERKKVGIGRRGG